MREGLLRFRPSGVVATAASITPASTASSSARAAGTSCATPCTHSNSGDDHAAGARRTSAIHGDHSLFELQRDDGDHGQVLPGVRSQA
jgi:hypothetical protein